MGKNLHPEEKENSSSFVNAVLVPKKAPENPELFD